MTLKQRIRDWLHVPDSNTAENMRMDIDNINNAIARMKPIVDAASLCAVDIGMMRDPTIIVVASKIGGGFVQFVSVKSPSTITDIRALVNDVEARYGVRTEVVDAPRSVQELWGKL